MPVFRVKGHTRDFPRVPFQAATAIYVEYKSGGSNIQTAPLYIKNPGSLVGFRLVIVILHRKGGKAFVFIVTKGTNNTSPNYAIMNLRYNIKNQLEVLYGKNY
jgi:hypothetical protein